MLTEKQYQTLCKYRDNFVSASDKPDSMTLDLLACGAIRVNKVEYTKKDQCIVFYQQTFWELTKAGKLALEEYERYMCEKCTEEKRNEKKAKAQRASNRFDMVTFGTISAIIGGLVVYYWPRIIACFSRFFH